jgi:hypothetical protein
MDAEKVKYNLFEELVKHRAFWSFQNVRYEQFEGKDEYLIEKVLIHLSKEQVRKLFKLYPEKLIKQVWKQNILIQDPYFHYLNIYYATLFYPKKNPDKYVKRAHYYLLKKRLAS